MSVSCVVYNGLSGRGFTVLCTGGVRGLQVPSRAPDASGIMSGIPRGVKFQQHGLQEHAGTHTSKMPAHNPKNSSKFSIGILKLADVAQLHGLPACNLADILVDSGTQVDPG